MLPRPLPALALAGGLCLLAACQADRPADAATTARAPGQISVPFRNRWWHFYERGLSWADGGLDAQAEADFRQCLRLRQTDSRLARTYGMHFVQCFAHRELGAVLLRRGALDEAERELRQSLADEPSAKTEWLLQRLVAARAGAQAAAPAPAPAAAAPAARSLELARVEPVQALLRVSGRLLGDTQAVLWRLDAAGTPTRVPTDASGAFQAEVAPDTTLALGTAAGPAPEAAPPLAVAPPAQQAASLELDGPDQGAVVADGRAWYRWQAAAGAGLARLEVHDDHGTPLASLPLRGLRAAGTLRLELAAGAQTLDFRVVDALGAETRQQRRVEARPSPQQDRRLRAVALAIPLQSARSGGLRPSDDPRLRSALLEDGRFRFVDAQADELLTRELTLVEAGYVDRSTAAAAGQRLLCRYVIAGTVTRGERDAECFLRLIHCDSGQVVATADAYSEIAASADADRLFAATAGRLRQVFPVVAGQVRTVAGGTRFACGSRGGAQALMRIHVFPGADATGSPSGQLELTAVAADSATATRQAGSIPDQAWGISE